MIKNLKKTRAAREKLIQKKISTHQGTIGMYRLFDIEGDSDGSQKKREIGKADFQIERLKNLL